MTGSLTNNENISMHFSSFTLTPPLEINVFDIPPGIPTAFTLLLYPLKFSIDILNRGVMDFSGKAKPPLIILSRENLHCSVSQSCPLYTQGGYEELR